MKKNLFYFLLPLLALLLSCSNNSKIIWSIGSGDGSSSEFALSPSSYWDYMASDFGFEDRCFIINHSKASEEFPYALPGPVDIWGGTWGGSCWFTHEINLLFSLENNKLLRSRTNLSKNEVLSSSKCKLVVGLAGVSSKGSLVKLDINGLISEKFDLSPGMDTVLCGGKSERRDTLEFEFSSEYLCDGGNTIKVSILEGGWIVFDNLYLETPSSFSLLENDNQVYLRSVAVADYEIDSCQPLLVDVQHISGNPQIDVELDGNNIFSQKLDTSRYILEAPMPRVDSITESNYEIKVNGRGVEKGIVTRNKVCQRTLSDYVDTKMGTGHSRWMIAPGPWMPFGMVKLSPDNQNPGWQAGYQPTFESIGCFSHIHEWTMAGLGVMPVNGELQIKVGDERNPDSGYRSRIDKRTEKASIGLYKVLLEDYNILAEVSATTRASMMKFTFPDSIDGRVLIDLQIPAEYSYQLKSVDLKKTSDSTIEGVCHQLSPHVWSHDVNQDYTINFCMEFDRNIKNVGVWKNDSVYYDSTISGNNLLNAGMFVEFDTKDNPQVQVRTGISYVSVNNAYENLKTEIIEPFGWNFDAVVDNQKKVWNDILERVRVKTSDQLEKTRFYTNLYRAHSRNTFSDVNGEWMNPDEEVSKFVRSDDFALGCDAFWNTFWNLNQVWNLITPEWSSRWVRSQLAMYDQCGWLAKGPAGMQYVPVMVAEHEIPQMISAYQMGIRDYDSLKLLSAVVKMQTSPSRKIKGGYAGNRDLLSYLKYHYVPYELGTFSNSLEYSFDDWTVGQLAKSLGRHDIFKQFDERGSWWKNTFNSETGYAHVRDSNGKFADSFDPFKGAINGRYSYTEGNAWQLSFFVPQNPLAMIETIGRDRFLDRLQWGFSESEKWRFNSPNERYDAFPVVQGNQQSMHFAFLFNWGGRPWLTQKWSRSIIDRYYGYGNVNAYLGDEDQGQMSAWFVMASMGLFQLDGGCSTNPIYEISSPIFEEISIDLGEKYGRGKNFKIRANGVSRKAKYIQSATLNGKELNTFYFPASELLKGGELVLEMSDTPNEKWGLIY